MHFRRLWKLVTGLHVHSSQMLLQSISTDNINAAAEEVSQRTHTFTMLERICVVCCLNIELLHVTVCELQHGQT